MPRIAENLDRCVFFLFGHSPKTGQLIGPGATGFFVGKSSESLDYISHIYAVTNRHVVANWSCIRVNEEDHKTRLLEFDPSEWIWSDTDDLAALDVTDFFPSDPHTLQPHHQISWVHDFQLTSKESAWSRDIGIGDQIVMLGLFTDHSGSKRNVPVGRFGLLSATPDDDVPVRLWEGDMHARPAYLGDMRSRSGFSGSPVWVWRTPYDDMNEVGLNGLAQRFNPRNTLFSLLGVHRGQFKEQTIVTYVDAERPLKSGDSIDIASSMTVIVPAWEVASLLDNDTFKAQRAIRDSKPERIKFSKAIADTMNLPNQ